MSKIAIIGLGLIGTSIALALKRSGGSNEVVGFDKLRESGEWVQSMGAIRTATPSVEAAVSGASMVIVATPIINMRKVFEEMAPHLQKGTVVTDTASTKEDVMRWAREQLPAGTQFVGGHPMAGKEQAGPGAAEPTLFDGRPYCVIPGEGATTGSVNAVLDLARAIGARPFFLDAAEHDSYAAGISHAPLIASIALFTMVRSSAAWPELAAMAGPGFRDLTRLASGMPEMAHDICLTNRENLLHWLERYVAEIQRLAALIDGGEPAALFRALAEAQIERENFITEAPQRKDSIQQVDLPTAGEMFMDSMIGSQWRARAAEMTAAVAEREQARARQRRLRRQD
jgi:prephenate dehydrogenase